METMTSIREKPDSEEGSPAAAVLRGTDIPCLACWPAQSLILVRKTVFGAVVLPYHRKNVAFWGEMNPYNLLSLGALTVPTPQPGRPCFYNRGGYYKHAAPMELF